MASVRDILSASPATVAVASLDLGSDRAVTVWENADDRIDYDAPSGHAFSLYLEGGAGTRRIDGRDEPGRPGAVCVMPEGRSSRWRITDRFRFVHLYLPDAELRGAFARIHDCDARRLDLPEITFADMPSLAAPLHALAGAAIDGDIVLADAALAELVGRLGHRRIALRGGLPQHRLRRIDECIDANLDRPLRLDDLANLVDLSPFHLHRMFRATRGLTLHDWITWRRLDGAKAMMCTNASLLEIALACGFSSHSHFGRAFRAGTGTTPAAYR